MSSGSICFDSLILSHYLLTVNRFNVTIYTVKEVNLLKKTTTKSYSLPIEIAEQIDALSSDLGVSASAVITAILSGVLKWNLKEIFKNGISGR